MTPTVRPATHEDYEAVVAFTSDTWADRETTDYIPEIYHDWIDKERARTLVAETDEHGVVAIAQAVLLSDHEAWAQGMRVAPAVRGEGVGRELVHELFDWARERGATVARNMVFSWNDAGLGQSRATGFAPATEFRWATPTPDADASATRADDHRVTTDPDAAWGYWTGSTACRHLRGLALSPNESWALQELTRETLRAAADDDRLLTIRSPAGTRGFAFRVRTVEYERDDDDEETDEADEDGDDGPTTGTFTEYGVGAWTDTAAADALFAAIARDAASAGADHARVLIPERVGAVSDAALVRAGIGDEPDFVLTADLTADYRDR